MQNFSMNFEAIGTKWQINVSDDVSKQSQLEITRVVKKRIAQFDKNYSRFRPDSWVSKLQSRAGKFSLPSDAYPLLAFYDTLYHASDTHVTPLIGQAMNQAGYDSSYSFIAKPLTRPADYSTVVSLDHHYITITEPITLDIGAAGKGYLVDSISNILLSHGLQSFVINAGGDLIHRGKRAIEVGLENPFNLSQVIGTIELVNKSLCASSGSRRKWAGFTHIIDPYTLTSPTDVVATWVIADTTMVADGLATALFFVSPDKLRESFAFSAAVMYRDGSVKWDPAFNAHFFEEAAA